MTLEQLRVFVAVAEALHVTRAVESLHMTQSAASASIAVPESRHDTTLFHRVGRGIELSAEGVQFLPEARAVLLRVAQAERCLSELNGLQRGELCVAASQTVVTTGCRRGWSVFPAAIPVVECTSRPATPRRRSARCSTAAPISAWSRASWTATAARRPGWTATGLVVQPPGHAWLQDVPVDAAVLASVPWVMRERGSGTRRLLEDELRRHDVNPAALRVVLEPPSNAEVLAAIDAGAGARRWPPIYRCDASRSCASESARHRGRRTLHAWLMSGRSAVPIP